MSGVLEHIGNPLDLGRTEIYAAILGESPSKGAKSPTLWNAAFAGLGISGMMHPMDVTSARLPALVDALRSDAAFIGGAVTMPYKIEILPLLDELEPEAATIGAVNCIYRNGSRLVGANTDGAGALWSLERAFGAPLSGRTVLLMGAGGAGLAVAAYIARAIGSQGTLLLANRNAASRDAFAGRLREVCTVETFDLPVSAAEVARAEIIVNCTSIGFETQKQDDQGVFFLDLFSPLGSVVPRHVRPGAEARQAFAAANAEQAGANFAQTLSLLALANNPLVFDIVYQPENTMLLQAARRMGLRTLSGLPMNLEQAVIAFDKASAGAGLRPAGTDGIRSLMRAVA